MSEFDPVEFWAFNRKVAEAIGYHVHKYDHVNDHGPYAKTFEGYGQYILHNSDCCAVDCEEGHATCTSKSSWHDSEEDAWDDCSAFSEDIGCAMFVVEKLLTMLPQQDIHMEHLEGEGWKVLTCQDYEMYDAEAETLPHAICLFALNVVDALAQNVVMR